MSLKIRWKEWRISPRPCETADARAKLANVGERHTGKLEMRQVCNQIALIGSV